MGAVVEYFKTHLDHMSGMEKEAVERAVSLLDRLPTQGEFSPFTRYSILSRLRQLCSTR